MKFIQKRTYTVLNLQSLKGHQTEEPNASQDLRRVVEMCNKLVSNE